MTQWQPLSVRRGVAKPEDALFEGIPDHMSAQITAWVSDGFYQPGIGVIDPTKLNIVTSRLRLAVPPGSRPTDVLAILLHHAQTNQDLCLDVLDLMLLLNRHDQVASDLASVLQVAGSAWRVSEDKKSLARRVDEAAAEAYTQATSATDEVSVELRAAWKAAYGRTSDASDAWDHSIKAVEEAYKPIISPNDAGATLGNILGQLRGQAAQYSLDLKDNGLQPSVDPIDALEKMMHLIWPNPDRHGGVHKREPSLGEAQAVVNLAVLLVQWARSGVIRKR